jgi:hypothetical protein
MMALDNFFRFVGDFRSVAALMGKAALLAPFVDLLLNIGPPWPGKTGVPALTTLAEVFVLIYVFEFFTPLSRKRLQTRLRVFFIILVGSFALYIALYSFSVFHGKDARKVAGFIYLPLVRQTYPNHTREQLLPLFAHNPELLWRAWTVYTMRVTLLLAWVLFFVGIVSCIGIFVILQHKSALKRATQVS